MPIDGASFAAGPYAATYDSVSIGIIRAGGGQGSVLRIQPEVQAIKGTNSYGSSLIGGIYLGRDANVRGVLLEYKTATLKLLFPITAGLTVGRIGTLGQDVYDLAKALVLTAATSSLAAAAGPATLTASKAVLAPNFPLDISLDIQLREIPFDLALLPFLDTTFPANFTYT